MIHEAWLDWLPARLWQVVLHSTICGSVFFLWTRRLRLPSGSVRRRALAASIVIPLLTAFVPGRLDPAFRSGLAWFDSSRIFALPGLVGIRPHHVVLVLAGLAVLATIWQELLPVLARRPAVDVAPERVRRLAHSLPGWERCRVGVIDGDAIEIATDGWPWRPRALLSQGALATLDDAAIDAALAHEHAHWRRGRWWVVHLLFVVRLLQCFNPIALWCFREYCLEAEIACDAAAARDGHRRPLARALLEVYRTTDPRDRSREGLRKRIEILVGRLEHETSVVAPGVEWFAFGVLIVVLPWVV